MLIYSATSGELSSHSRTCCRFQSHHFQGLAQWAIGLSFRITTMYIFDIVFVGGAWTLHRPPEDRLSGKSALREGSQGGIGRRNFRCRVPHFLRA